MGRGTIIKWPMDRAVWCPFLYAFLPRVSKNCIEASSFLDDPLVSGTASLPLTGRERVLKRGERCWTRQASPCQLRYSAYKECLMLSHVSHFNSGTRIHYQSRMRVEAGVKKNNKNQTKTKALTDQKLHVSDLLPLAAIPWVKGHPSTM